MVQTNHRRFCVSVCATAFGIAWSLNKKNVKIFQSLKLPISIWYGHNTTIYTVPNTSLYKDNYVDMKKNCNNKHG